MNQDIRLLKQQLKSCMIKDQFFLAGKLNVKNNAQPLSQKELDSIKSQIERSMAYVNRREQALPNVQYPPELPVTDKCEEIKKLIAENQVVVLSGETGSGKTTQIPKICLELGLGVKGVIGHTQPRRIAARSVASRIADELKTEIGSSVGYKVRFSDHVSDMSHIKLMTDGILLAEVQNDRYLLQYEVIIIDEAHERSLNVDFILGYLKTILKKRPDLKIIITSATIDTEKFSKHFNDAPVIEVSGRTYPVEVLYRPIEESEDSPSLQKAISNAIFELNRHSIGDILVFLPGEREIRETAEYLRKHHPPHVEILPLFSRLSVKDQQKIFKAHTGSRVVLATNVAETSLTVPGIRYVIDSGLARVSRYNVRSRIQRLPIEPISQAAANQRAGRCGRVSAGICVRLYSEEDYINRPLFTDPEILRVNLGSAILQMKVLKIGDVFNFPFINKPERKYINDGIKLLEELGAINQNQDITKIGKILGKFSIDPRLGRMLVEANIEGCVSEILILAAFLTIQDPRERPFEFQQKADACHKRFEDKKSDFLAILNLWKYYQEQARHLSQNKLRKLCKTEFLSYLRMREWKDILIQLKSSVSDIAYKLNKEESNYEKIHRSLLSGLLSNIGFRLEESEFQGTKQKKFFIFPGSNLKKKPPKWIMAAEIVETQRNYARNVARIEPEWVVNLSPHLINKQYFEPHWQKRSEQVGAFEKVSLYGLVLVPKRRVNYGSIDPVESRKLFIRHALIYGEMNSLDKVIESNLEKTAEIELMEQKTRRQDMLVPEEEIFSFYDQRLPLNIYSGHAFRKWLKKEKKESPDILQFDVEKLVRETASEFNRNMFPDTLIIHGFQFPLQYHFQPGSVNDGVTARIPVGTLSQIEEYWFEWLIPGLLNEKLIALIKSLPKGLRRNFVPVPDYAEKLLNALTLFEKPLITSIIEVLRRITGIEVNASDFDNNKLADHLFFNFELVDAQEKIIATGKNLSTLKIRYADLAQKAFQNSPVEDLKIENITQWDFGSLPESKEIKTEHGVFKSYPALVDESSSVSLQYVPTKSVADTLMKKGLLRLIKLNLGKDFSYLQKNLADIQKICLLANAVYPCNELKSDLVDLIVTETYLLDYRLIVDKESFERLLKSGNENLLLNSNSICSCVLEIFQLFHESNKLLKKLSSPALLESSLDIKEHINSLIYKGFIGEYMYGNILHYPRYFKAIKRRVEKLSSGVGSDRSNMLKINKYCVKYKTLKECNDSNKLANLKWMIEEYRVSLYAQELKTAFPISEKRLDKEISQITKS